MIFNLLQIEKIPRLKPILEENEHFECKISIKSQMDKVTKLINNVLKNDSTNLQLFKESPFGHFLDLSNNYEHSSQVMWLLLIREAYCDRDSEMWFVVNGVPIRFSLMEYALISGLKCSEYPEGWETQAKSNAFKDRHFRGKEIVSIDDVKAKFTHMSNPNQSNRVRRNLNVSNKEILKMEFFYLSLRPKCTGTKVLLTSTHYYWVWLMIWICSTNTLGGLIRMSMR